MSRSDRSRSPIDRPSQEAELQGLRTELAACQQELNQYREMMYTDRFAAFSQRWPGTLEEEFNTFVGHTSEAYKSDRTSVLRERAGYADAAFVVQVDCDEEGECDIAARSRVAEPATCAGFRNIDSTGSRAAFEFVPGCWERFRRSVDAAAREENVALKRVLLCRAPLGLWFRYPEDGA